MAASTASRGIVIEKVEISDAAKLKSTAAFFVGAFWQDYKSEAQLSPLKLAKLAGEQLVDMRMRYAGSFGLPAALAPLYGTSLGLPSALLVARSEDGEIVGCAGVEVGLFSGQKLMPKNRENAGSNLDRRAVLANVAVSPEARGRGVARKLCVECEEVVKSWGNTEMLLLVESENTPALALYRKLGYKEVWRDTEAKAAKVVPNGATAALQNVQVTLVAMRKDLTRKPGLFGLGIGPL